MAHMRNGVMVEPVGKFIVNDDGWTVTARAKGSKGDWETATAHSSHSAAKARESAYTAAVNIVIRKGNR